MAASLGSDPEDLTQVGNQLFFTAQGPGGRELWKSDGSEAGTVRLKDIRPGRYSSQISQLTNVDGTLFFRAYDGIDGGLWISDGTSAGTRLVAYQWGTQLTSFNGKLYFAMEDWSQLWSSDGTAEGTVVVHQFSKWVGELEPVADRLFISAVSGGANDQLWVTDGTSAGMSLVRVDRFPNSSGIFDLTFDWRTPLLQARNRFRLGLWLHLPHRSLDKRWHERGHSSSQRPQNRPRRRSKPDGGSWHGVPTGRR